MKFQRESWNAVLYYSSRWWTSSVGLRHLERSDKLLMSTVKHRMFFTGGLGLLAFKALKLRNGKPICYVSKLCGLLFDDVSRHRRSRLRDLELLGVWRLSHNLSVAKPMGYKTLCCPRDTKADSSGGTRNQVPELPSTVAQSRCLPGNPCKATRKRSFPRRPISTVEIPRHNSPAMSHKRAPQPVVAL